MGRAKASMRELYDHKHLEFFIYEAYSGHKTGASVGKFVVYEVAPTEIAKLEVPDAFYFTFFAQKLDWRVSSLLPTKVGMYECKKHRTPAPLTSTDRSILHHCKEQEKKGNLSIGILAQYQFPPMGAV